MQLVIYSFTFKYPSYSNTYPIPRLYSMPPPLCLRAQSQTYVPFSNNRSLPYPISYHFPLVNTVFSTQSWAHKLCSWKHRTLWLQRYGIILNPLNSLTHGIAPMLISPLGYKFAFFSDCGFINQMLHNPIHNMMLPTLFINPCIHILGYQVWRIFRERATIKLNGIL